MNRGRPTGLVVVVRWEGEPVGRHHLLAGQQITIGTGRAADLRVARGAIRRSQPLLQAGTNGYHLLLPPGGRVVCRAASPCPAGGYRVPERRVYEAGQHPGDELSLCFDPHTRASITAGCWHVSVRPAAKAPDWAAHSPEVVAQGFRQSLTWHQDRQTQLKRGTDGAARARCWPFLLLSGGLHLTALLLVLAVPPDTGGCCSFFRRSNCLEVETVAPRAWEARLASIRTSFEIDERIDVEIEPPPVSDLRMMLKTALDSQRSFLRTCLPGWWPPRRVAVLLEADGRGRVTRSEVQDPWMPAASKACMQVAMQRWRLPAYRWPVEVKTRLDLVARADSRRPTPRRPRPLARRRGLR